MGRARDRRLQNDAAKIENWVKDRNFVQIIEKEGLPATEYVLKFMLKGYLNENGEIANEHLLKISLPEQYPFAAPPKFTLLNGLFHPNVYKSGDVCHGWYLNNWTPAIHIDDLLMDVAKMICFKTNSYNLKSPANYDCNAEWIEAHSIPTDTTSLEVAFKPFFNRKSDSAALNQVFKNRIFKNTTPAPTSSLFKQPEAEETTDNDNVPFELNETNTPSQPINTDKEQLKKLIKIKDRRKQ